jgi:hypothetical protein
MDSWCQGHSYEYLRAKNRLPQTKPAPEGLIDPKSYYIGYEDGKKAPQTKPLSDEEIHELIVNKVTDYELCRAIEKRHGIK